MDWMTFSSNAIDSLAWPAAIVCIVWWLREHIGKLLPFTKRLRYGNLEIEFERDLASLELEVAKQEQALPAEEPIPQDEESIYVHSVAEISPRAALVDAWVNLELTANTSAQAIGANTSEKMLPFSKVVRILQDGEVIGEEDAKILYRLRNLRNKALHSSDFEISSKEAEAFFALTRSQAYRIAAKARNIGGTDET